MGDLVSLLRGIMSGVGDLSKKPFVGALTQSKCGGLYNSEGCMFQHYCN